MVVKQVNRYNCSVVVVVIVIVLVLVRVRALIRAHKLTHESYALRLATRALFLWNRSR